MKHVMVDMETLGTTADAVILSIGAVRFDLESDAVDDAGFYASITIDSNLDAGRRIQQDTLTWWMQQGAAAQKVFHEEKQSLGAALFSFETWLSEGKDPIMWSNGADFDLPMLSHAYVSQGNKVPWKFWNSRCFRTYKNLPGAKAVRMPPTGVKHNALTDAFNQARQVQVIHAALFGAKK